MVKVPNKLFYFIVALALGGLVYVLMNQPTAEDYSIRNESRVAHSKISNLFYGLINFAIKHDKKFPNKLQELEDSGSIDDLKLDTIISYPSRRAERTVKYLSGYNLHSPPDSIILYVEAHTEDNMLISTVQGEIKIISKAEFEKQLKAQQAELKK